MIDDRSESEYWYERGRNRVWKDYSFRGQVVLIDGPTTKATPYNALYLSDPVATAKLLGFSEQKLLQAPEIVPMPEAEREESYPFGIIALYDKNNPLAYVHPSNHVLPLPMIDVILATSRLRSDWFGWYPSPLRLRWAEHTLVSAQEDVFTSQPNAAALKFATVFGTCLPGFVVGDQADSEMLKNAWRGISVLVDEKVFLEHMMRAFVGRGVDDVYVPPEQNKKGFLHDMVRDIFRKFYPDIQRVQGVGPEELKVAEKVDKLEQEIAEFRRKLADGGLPAGTEANVEFVHWDEGLHRIRFASEIFEFERKSLIYKRTRSSVANVVWIFDRDDQNKLKALSLPPWAAAHLREDNKYFLMRDSEWVVEVAKVRTSKYHVDYDAEYRVQKDFLGEPVRCPYTEAEQAQLPQASKERLQGYYNGRHEALNRLERMQKEHDDIVNDWVKRSDSVAKQTVQRAEITEKITAAIEERAAAALAKQEAKSQQKAAAETKDLIDSL